MSGKDKDNSDNAGVTNPPLVCSFCGKSEKEVKKIVLAGANKKPICNECIVTCSQILKDAL